MRHEYNRAHPRTIPIRVHRQLALAALETPGDAPRYSTPPPMHGTELGRRIDELVRLRDQVQEARTHIATFVVSPGQLAGPAPTVRERAVQDILFENSEKIPEGLYKQLMDALVIRG